VPPGTYVGDIFPSALDAHTVFVAFNNWQRGDYTPYVLKSTDRGRTWTNVTGNLPARHHVWAIAQDGVTPDLLFAGTELGLFTSVDGGQRWVELRAGLPPAQVRDLQLQAREHDLVIGTFGRGIFILDDYSPLREMTPVTLAAPFHLFAVRDAYLFQPWGLSPDGSSGFASMAGNVTRPNPPFGATFTYHVRGQVPEDARLVLSIVDERGADIRELGLELTAGLYRATWDLRADPAVETRAAADPQPEAAPAAAEADQDPRAASGAPRTRSAAGPLVSPGVYRATLALRRGSQLSPVAAPRSFAVRDLPPADYVVPR
jgi:hypothetical protein